ncbi:MAG: CrcB family protein [Pseudomonadota bacterium]
MTFAHSLSLVMLGGAVGSGLRFAVVTGAGRLLGSGWPFGTFAVNVLGSFAMGVLAVWIMERNGAAGLALMTGVLGGFTTFSAFSLDAVRLVEADRVWAALGYAGGSVVASVAALALGMLVARGGSA